MKKETRRNFLLRDFCWKTAQCPPPSSRRAALSCGSRPEHSRLQRLLPGAAEGGIPNPSPSSPTPHPKSRIPKPAPRPRIPRGSGGRREMEMEWLPWQRIPHPAFPPRIPAFPALLPSAAGPRVLPSLRHRIPASRVWRGEEQPGPAPHPNPPGIPPQSGVSAGTGGARSKNGRKFYFKFF